MMNWIPAICDPPFGYSSSNLTRGGFYLIRPNGKDRVRIKADDGGFENGWASCCFIPITFGDYYKLL